MKQLLFLLLFPCLAMAQYPGNAGQKITLGEQTTADGLVFRGVASIDTVTATSKITRANKLDTSAYLLLDTVTNLLWHYKTASNGWIQAGGGVSVSSFSAGSTGLTPSDATTGAVTLGGTLAVANGGTGQSTLAAAGIITGTGSKTRLPLFTGSTTVVSSNFYQNSLGNIGIGIEPRTGVAININGNRNSRLQIDGAVLAPTDTVLVFEGIAISPSTRNRGFGFYGGTKITFNTGVYYDKTMIFNSSGQFGIGTNTPQSGYRLHVVDSVYVGGRVSAAGYTTRSDYDLKDEIQSINYGLNEVMQMQPVKYTYKSNGEQQLGFIAQDIGTLIPESVHFDEFMGVDYQSIIPILSKAIQEQQSLIKALEQRILTLENK